MCFPSYFVHMKNTTGQDKAERGEYPHHTQCSQCDAPFDPETASKYHVAAHVVAYPCCIPCCGVKTLKTTCSKCNNHHNAESAQGRGFFGGCFPDHNPCLGCVCASCCENYDAGEEAALRG